MNIYQSSVGPDPQHLYHILLGDDDSLFESTPPKAAAQEKSAKLGQEKCATAEQEKSTIKPQLNATPVVNFDLDLSEDMFAESMLLEEVSTTSNIMTEWGVYFCKK